MNEGAEEIMSNDELFKQEIEALYREFVPNGTPDKDHVQQVLTRKFVKLLKARDDLPVDEVVKTFAGVWEGSLSWLGEARQDEILKVAMARTGVDLRHWVKH